LRRNGHLAQKNEPEKTNSFNGNQLQVIDSIRRKRTNGASTDSQPVLRPKRKNTENQIEPLQANVIHEEPDLEPVKVGRAVRKTTRNLRSNSNIKQSKESDEVSDDVLLDERTNGKSVISKESSNAKKNPTPPMLQIMRKLNENVSKESSNAKKNPTPAMLEIMRKLNEKKKT
jgi:hypothetical protein